MTMVQVPKAYRVFLSAAEPSADAHCAGLIGALASQMPDLEFVGIGGDKMAAAGCRLMANTTHKAAMGHHALMEVTYFYGLLREIRRFFRQTPVDLVIVCDSPSFNFHVAKAAKRDGIPTVFYVAPQLWAWAGWRIRKLRRCCDKLCCLLPFEEPWFGDRGVDAHFVGNPLLEGLGDLSGNAKTFGKGDTRPLKVALMPGSRTAEIQALWKPMQQIGLRLRDKHPSAQLVAVAVNEQRKHQLAGMQIAGFECDYSIDSVYPTSRQVDFALVASGSATLEVAAAGCPMVVMYKTSPILWHLLGRWLFKSKYFSLVNLIADRELVTEFLPYFTSIDPIVARVESLLSDRGALARLSRELVAITQPLATKKASAEVARVAMEWLQPGRQNPEATILRDQRDSV